MASGLNIQKKLRPGRVSDQHRAQQEKFGKPWLYAPDITSEYQLTNLLIKLALN
jgi:hypothetical protein